jgi:hypothetical protein
MQLRTITNVDLDLWIRMQCDPVMMADLGGPQPLEKMPQIFKNTLNVVTNKTGWVDVILVGANEDQVAGSVCIWESGHDGHPVNEMGWMVLPDALVPAVEKLAQNLYICPSTVAQHAALACFEPESIAEYERRRAEFRARRDFLVPALESIGLPVPVMPDGAFYAWADCSRHSANSWDFVHDVMRRAHVAITPGRDFGHHGVERYVRLSYANSMAQLEESVDRLRNALAR